MLTESWVEGKSEEEKDAQPTERTADELKATVKESWASIPPQQCHKLITSMPHRIEAVIKAKGAPPSIEYIYSKLTYFPEGQQLTKHFCFFIGLMKYSNFLENLWVFVKCEPKSSQLKEPKTTSVCVHWIYLIHKIHNLSWITEINELFHDILIYWDAPVCVELFNRKMSSGYIWAFFLKWIIESEIDKMDSWNWLEIINSNTICITRQGWMMKQI